MAIPPVANTSQLHTLAPLCPSGATRFVLPCLYALIFLTGLPGNALSLWVFFRRIPNRTSTHVYLSHLGLSNLLLCLTAPFQAVYYLQGAVWSAHSALCQAVIHGVTPVQQINIYVGVFILTWVALSRFATLIQQTHASRPSLFATLLPDAFFSALRRPMFARAVCTGVWVAVAGAIVPVTVYYSVMESKRHAGGERGGGDTGEEERGGVCYNYAVEAGGSLSRGSSVAAIVVFFVCFLLVIALYVSVARHVRRSRQSAAVNSSQQLLGKVFRNIVVIQVVLTVCLLPHHIFKSIFIAIVENQEQADPVITAREPCHSLSAAVEVKNFLLCLASLRSSADPVMYFLLDKTFHKNISSMFRSCPEKTSSQSDGGTSSQAKVRTNRTNGKLEEKKCPKSQGSWKDFSSMDWSENSGV
ncbi:hypothetical protein DPEC_G00138830 [Dallia pectoralis]|uniref:Uncharacterized protein n=1 Tax=Dallia pectoralis TaxID=75939 RepID=A0ACC2GM93_DALPE|nr:hypothetical protein DPEC_G00138830 [Dallia pectoralis]